MAHASKKHIGAGAQGKGDGSAAMAPETPIRENAVLSNRDKKQETGQRGHDGKWTQAEQMHDTELNQQTQSGSSGGQQMSGQWAEQQKKSLKKQEQAARKNQQQAANTAGRQQGDNQREDERARDETIGEAAYAHRDPEKKKTGEF